MKKTLMLMIATMAIIIVGCTTTKLVETPPGSGVFKKVAEVDPRVTTGLNTATGISEVVGPINLWHGIVTIGIGAVAAFAEWNKRRKQAQLDAVVAGVEAKGGTDVKEAIKTAAMASGIEAELNKTVTRITGG